jgi:AraC family transcriptional activator of mtrCDE
LTVALNPFAKRINYPMSFTKLHRLSADPLSAIAPLLRVRRVEVEELCSFASPWNSPHEARTRGWAQFHIVVKGSCRVELPGGERLNLRTGSLLLLPHGDAHAMRSATRVKGAESSIRVDQRGFVRVKTNTEGESDTELICGRLLFDEAASSLIIAALPAAIVVNVNAMQPIGQMRALVQMVDEELRSDRAGTLAIASHLSTALFVLMLRMHLEQVASSSGLIKLLSSPIGAKAVNAMVHDPAHAWTLDELAQKSHVSRATLVRAFQKAAGIPPLAFLGELRLSLARQSLVSSQEPLTEIAAAAGYSSESAFIRAFTRRFGISPGKMRAQ